MNQAPASRRGLLCRSGTFFVAARRSLPSGRCSLSMVSLATRMLLVQHAELRQYQHSIPDFINALLVILAMPRSLPTRSVSFLTGADVLFPV